MTRGGGGGPNSGRGHQEDQNRWVHLVGMLKKKELLPVVAFTFSKKRCEENATSMPNTDLCSAKEKSEIHIVIERSLTRLNGKLECNPLLAFKTQCSRLQKRVDP
jgi:antiviral helicase SKI2